LPLFSNASVTDCADMRRAHSLPKRDEHTRRLCQHGRPLLGKGVAVTSNTRESRPLLGSVPSHHETCAGTGLQWMRAHPTWRAANGKCGQRTSRPSEEPHARDPLWPGWHRAAQCCCRLFVACVLEISVTSGLAYAPGIGVPISTARSSPACLTLWSRGDSGLSGRGGPPYRQRPQPEAVAAHVRAAARLSSRGLRTQNSLPSGSRSTCHRPPA
jgi:hypothetical protein